MADLTETVSANSTPPASSAAAVDKLHLSLVAHRITVNPVFLGSFFPPFFGQLPHPVAEDGPPFPGREGDDGLLISTLEPSPTPYKVGPIPGRALA